MSLEFNNQSQCFGDMSKKWNLNKTAFQAVSKGSEWFIELIVFVTLLSLSITLKMV